MATVAGVVVMRPSQVARASLAALAPEPPVVAVVALLPGREVLVEQESPPLVEQAALFQCFLGGVPAALAE